MDLSCHELVIGPQRAMVGRTSAQRLGGPGKSMVEVTVEMVCSWAHLDLSQGRHRFINTIAAFQLGQTYSSIHFPWHKGLP